MELEAKVYTRTNENGTHYARIVVPKALKLFVAKPALWRSLSTKDDLEATKAGSIVAASTQIVLQEVSDVNAEAAVVVVDTELVGNKFNLAEALDDISQEDIALVAQSLREKFGIKNDDADKPDDGSELKSKKSGMKDACDKKVIKDKTDASDPKKLEQGSVALADSDIEKYIEKRPHGIYRLRVWVSKKLQKKLGQREVRETLKTRDRSEAVRRARPLILELQQRFMAIDQDLVFDR